VVEGHRLVARADVGDGADVAVEDVEVPVVASDGEDLVPDGELPAGDLDADVDAERRVSRSGLRRRGGLGRGR